MEWNKKFNYPSSTRALIQGKRHYSLDGSNLPSVTTILSCSICIVGVITTNISGRS